MRNRVLLSSALAFLLLLPVTAFAKKKSTPLPPPPRTTTSRDYVSALSAANRFLQAWQAEDHEAGLLMLTDSAKHQTSPERLESYFTPDSTQRAYEIARGKKLRAGRYAFPVAFFEHNLGGPPRTRYSQVIVVQTGGDDWAVDKLP